MADGKSQRMIAEEYEMSRKTVRSMLKKAIHQLNADSPIHAVILAFHYGYIKVAVPSIQNISSQNGHQHPSNVGFSSSILQASLKHQEYLLLLIPHFTEERHEVLVYLTIYSTPPSNQDIANYCGVTVNTVKRRLRNIYPIFGLTEKGQGKLRQLYCMVQKCYIPPQLQASSKMQPKDNR